MVHIQSYFILLPSLMFWNVGLSWFWLRKGVSIFNYWTSLTGICRYFRCSFRSLPTLHWPISSISLGTWVPKIKESSTWSFHVLSQNATLSAALSTLVRGNCSLFFPKLGFLALRCKCFSMHHFFLLIFFAYIIWWHHSLNVLKNLKWSGAVEGKSFTGIRRLVWHHHL